jgi:hypothetical protein
MRPTLEPTPDGDAVDADHEGELRAGARVLQARFSEGLDERAVVQLDGMQFHCIGNCSRRSIELQVPDAIGVMPPVVMSTAGGVAPFPEVLAQLRRERGMTVEDVGLELRSRVRARGESTKRQGASFSSFQKHAAGTAAGAPSVFLMEMVAEVFDVDPSVFVEYRLAKARSLFDERERPLTEAVQNATDALRRPDITLYDAKRNVLLAIEVKAPSTNVDERLAIEQLVAQIGPLAKTYHAAFAVVSHPDGDHIVELSELLKQDPAERFRDLAQEAGPKPQQPPEQRPGEGRTADGSRSESGG